MSYDNPSRREKYTLPSSAFGATTTSLKMRGPKGKSGTVRDIVVMSTANFVGTTSVPEITVGSAASTAGGTLYAEYARYRLGTTAVAGYATANGPFRARAAALTGPTYGAGGVPPVWSDFAGHVQLETAKIPADTDFYITAVQGVGGTPAGTASVDVYVDWD